MAFQTNNNAAGANNNNQSGNQDWKAQGFINIYLPTQDGKRRKLDAIPLHQNKANEKLLLDWLNEDPTRVEIIRAKMIMEYVSAEPAAGTAFDLSVPAAAAPAGNLP